MSRRVTKCLPFIPTSPAPPPTQWRAFCGRIIEEEDALDYDWPQGFRPYGACPRCWPRAVAMFRSGMTVSLVETESTQRTLIGTYPKAAP